MHSLRCLSRLGRPFLEVLEDRQLLATGVSLSGADVASVWKPVVSLSSAVLNPDSQHPGQSVLAITGKGENPGPGGALSGLPSGVGLSLDNHAPVAVNDSAVTAGGPISIHVTANDSDRDGDPLYVLYATNPDHGTLYRDSTHSNSFLYQPSASYSGSDSFSYSVYDSHGDSSEARVTISVRPPVSGTPSPVAQTDTPPDRSVTINVLSSNSDSQLNTRTLDGIAFSAQHGTTVIHDKLIVYTPAPTFTGTDRFVYQVKDQQGNTSWGVVNVHVGTGTLALLDDQAHAATGDAVKIDVLANDAHSKNDPLHIVSFTQPANGQVTQVGDKLQFTSAAGFSGQTSFSYIAADVFGTQATATVRLDVGDRPPEARHDEVWTHTGTSIAIGVLQNDSDPDHDHLTIFAYQATTASGGHISLGADNALVYTPAAGFKGDDVFIYIIADPSGKRSSASVSVHVGNRPPQAIPDLAYTRLNQPVTISVLQNDRDPDGDPLNLTLAASTSAQGGSVQIDSTNPRRVRYVPKTGFTGKDSFTYTIDDGHGGQATGTVVVMVG